MRRVAGLIIASCAVVALVVGACSALGPPELTATQRTWCREHQVPDLPGGASVAGAARDLGIASAEVIAALETLETTLLAGGKLAEAVVTAEFKNDALAAVEARAAYETWQADVAEPARKTAAAVLDGWSVTLEWAEACGAAWAGRASGSATSLPAPTGAPASILPTATPSPTPTPKPTPRLTAKSQITYTSSTSVGRLIELKITIRNPGTLKAGKVSVQVEGVDYAIKSRTPIAGCVPDCRATTGAEGIAYVEWTAPAPGKSRAYTVQLKARRAGTYEIAVRAYRGPAGDPIDEIARWTVKVRVR
jgi:hypothetical protein